jgi:hypothetical protein
LTRCQQCNTGETTSDEGTASCSSCDLGTFGNSKRECSACPIETYQDERKQLSCKTCPAGKMPNTQQTSCEFPEWKTVSVFVCYCSMVDH